MPNTLTASITFYFKGEQLSPQLALDLDEVMSRHGKIPDLYPLLAHAAHIDPYSYEYEMMLSEEVQFSHAQGLCQQFMIDSQFDQERFEQQWHREHVFKRLAPLLKEQLDIDDIEQHPPLKKVLLEVWYLAQSNQ